MAVQGGGESGRAKCMSSDNGAQHKDGRYPVVQVQSWGAKFLSVSGVCPEQPGAMVSIWSISAFLFVYFYVSTRYPVNSIST